MSAYEINAFPLPELKSGHLRMEGSNPKGDSIQVTNQYLTYNGKPWIPVMGEYPYSRSDDSCWEEELLKIKAGGVSIIQSYVLWIHHEEEEGIFEFTGNRDLRRFVTLCHKHGQLLYGVRRAGRSEVEQPEIEKAVPRRSGEGLKGSKRPARPSAAIRPFSTTVETQQ